MKILTAIILSIFVAKAKSAAWFPFLGGNGEIDQGDKSSSSIQHSPSEKTENIEGEMNALSIVNKDKRERDGKIHVGVSDAPGST
jgi:hypothetical protein